LLLVAENGSSYSNNLLDFLSQKNIDFATLNYNDISVSTIKKFSSFILSGRKKNNQKMNSVNSQIIKHAVSENKSLLGICYGAEILALTLGGTIRKTNSTQNGIQTVEIIKENPLCSGIINVFQSHNYEISRLGTDLIGVAKSNYSEYEIIQHKKLKIFGTQFHPEMSKDGKSLIETFVSI